MLDRWVLFAGMVINIILGIAFKDTQSFTVAAVLLWIGLSVRKDEVKP